MTPLATSQRGFSLRDLIITLALLVLVLVLVLPMLRDIRQKENATACLVNLRENGLATLAYTQENDGRFPPFGFEIRFDDQGTLQADVLIRSRRSAGLDQFQPDNLLCPSDREQGELCVLDGEAKTPVPLSYGYNIDLIAQPRTLASLVSPATSTVLYDGSMTGGCGSGKDVRGSYQGAFAFAQRASDPRHADQINLVYADWHTVTVESLSRRSIELGTPPSDTPD